jgi:short-subunit dehydrogenase
VSSFRSSEAVVQTALRAYDRGAACVVDGRLNRVVSSLSRFAPRSAVTRIAARLMKPKAG